MALQSPQQVRVIDPILTDFAHGYVHGERVGNFLFPPVPVSVSGGQVIQFGKESFRKQNFRRAPGASKKRVSFGYKGDPYSLYQDAFEVPVPYEHMRDSNVVPGIDHGRQATMFAMDSGSHPDDGTQKRLGNYLMMVSMAGLTISSGMWITAMAANLAGVEMAKV